MTATWGEVTLREIIAPLKGELISGPGDLIIGGLSTDSRKIKAGDLFVALRGEKYDGHAFIRQAVDNGAAGIVIRSGHRPKIPESRTPAVIVVADTLKALGDLAGWWRHQQTVNVAAVTGSAGKTTTKEMSEGILRIGALTLKNKGNFNNLIGLPLTLLMLEKEHRNTVLEMGMNRPGEIARLTEIADPDIGLITNIGRAHLEGLGDIRGVAMAKVEMVERISIDSQVFLNGDDDLLMEAARPFRKNITTYGLGPGNQIRALNIRSLGREGATFELQHEGESIPLRLMVPGIQNVRNALAAATIALHMGAPRKDIVAGLKSFEGIKGRFMLTKLSGGAILIDDTYNSNPYSLRAAVNALKDLKTEEGRILLGLGEMMELGQETVPAHLEAGEMVAEMGAYYFVAMGAHAGEMIRGAIEKGFPSEKTLVVKTHQAMSRVLKAMMNAGDLILLKGSRKAGLEKVVESLKGINAGLGKK
jgi:UDP-N-acetylmuramoyl-tripeptide--D-alanyl-D-alanine ligase